MNAILSVAGVRIRRFRQESWIATSISAAGVVLSALGVKLRQWRQESWTAKTIQASSILLVVVNAVFGVLDKRENAVKLLGWDKCYMLDAVTEKPDHASNRPCLSGQVTFVKWTYPFKDRPDDIVDRPNRIFQVVRVDGGQVEWNEQQLRIDEHGAEKWDVSPTQFYIAVQGGQVVPSWQMLGNVHNKNSGFVLRRIDTVDWNCVGKTKQGSDAAQFKTQEFFIENTSIGGAVSDKKNVYQRQLASSCGQDVGAAFRIGGPFASPFEATTKVDP